MEKVPDSRVPLVKRLGVGTVKRQHDPRQRNRSGFECQVDMIGHQTIGIETKSEPISVVREPSKIQLPIRVVSKDVTLFVPARNHVVQRPREFQSWLSGHQEIREFNVSSVSLFVASFDDAAIQR
jgi:hypothetical protein